MSQLFSGKDTRPRQMIDIQYDIIIMGGREVSRPYRVGFSPKASGFCFWSRPWIIKGWGTKKSVEVHPLRTSTPTKPCNSVILVIFFSTVRAPCNC